MTKQLTQLKTLQECHCRDFEKVKLQGKHYISEDGEISLDRSQLIKYRQMLFEAMDNVDHLLGYENEIISW